MTGRAYLEWYYGRCCAERSAIQPHLPRLRALAEGCGTAVEFGVRRAMSSSALLLGADHVISYDVIEIHEAAELARQWPAWEYRIGDSRFAPVTTCDLLFLDSRHTFGQVDAELTRHADAVRRWLVFHDSVTFGSVGADGETGALQWTYRPGNGSVPPEALGIRPAIDALMIRDPSWRIAAHYTDSHGLLVLERRP